MGISHNNKDLLSAFLILQIYLDQICNITHFVIPFLLGYSVAAISTGKGVHFVAGAPRANYTGQIVLYSVNEKGNASVIQAHRGDQVNFIFNR